MAEAFGIAAGVIGVASLAIQLAQSVNDLKELRDKARNLPTELKETIEELDNLSELLAHIPVDLDLSADPANATLRSCVSLCSRGVAQSRNAASTLQVEAQHKRYRHAIRNTSTAKNIEAQLQKLERGKTSLMLAFQTYQMYVAANQRVYMREMLANQTALGQQVQSGFVSNNGCLGSKAVTKTVIKAGKTPASFTYRTPSWLSSTADINGIKDLLSSRDVLLYDRTPNGVTLIMTELTRFLHLQGLDGRSSNRNGCTALDIFFSSGWPLTCLIGRLDALHTDIKFITDDLEVELGVEDAGHVALHSVLMKPPPSWTHAERLTLLDSKDEEVTVADILEVFGPPLVDPSIFDVETEGGTTLLHILALASVRQPGKRGSTELLNILREGLRAGASIHRERRNLYHELDWETPFQCLLRTLAFEHKFLSEGAYEEALGRELVRDKIQFWIEEVQAAGHDLEEYGAVEHARFNDFRDQVSSSHPWYGFDRIVGFSYGPEPADWHVWWKHDGDGYAGEFWDMLEHPERRIPGAWLDRSETTI